ncbi:MAG TPA: c-type cytochrome [Actinomycetota bacterium]
MRRTLLLLAGIGILAVLLIPATGGASTGVAAQTAGGDTGELIARGKALYLQACASCHGPDPNGASQYPSTVPSLKDVGGAAAVDWAVRTGRMPWKSTVGPAIARGRSRFDAEDTQALDAYVGSAVGDAQLPQVDPAQGDIARGRQAYAQACSACHGMNGAGSALGGANIAPTLLDVKPLDVAEAIKIGPGQMPPGGGIPSYTPDDAQSIATVNDIAAYVQSLQTTPYNRGGLPIGGKGPVPEGFVAWIIGLGALVLVVRWLGGRT